MQTELAELLRRIGALATFLRHSVKPEAADYFELLGQKLTRPNESMRVILTEITTGAAMTQYCDFTPAEDVLWGAVYDQAELLLQKIYR